MLSERLLIFTDLDGSLLDHDTYSHAPADDLLAALKKNHVPVIPCTSKTQAELEAIRTELENNHPFIAENGAAVFIPEEYFAVTENTLVLRKPFWVKEFIQSRAHWQSLLAQLPNDLQETFITFEQAGVKGIAQMTGLNMDQATLAANRQYGEPLKWLGTEAQRNVFIQLMHQAGANVLQGGRFLHISGQTNKGLALNWLKQQYSSSAPTRKTIALALGDSDNDIAMLEAADYAVIIRSPSHPPPIVTNPNPKQVYTTQSEGPSGWVEGVHWFLEQQAMNLD